MNETKESDVYIAEELQDLSCLRIVCSKCNEKLANESVQYCSKRVGLQTFLQTSFEGQMILFYYEKHGSLSKLKQDSLCNLLIERELFILLQKENVSLENPLKTVK